MAMQLTPEERETIINTDDSIDYVSVYTFDRKLINRMKKVQAEYPDDCRLIHVQSDGSHEWYIPKSWLYRIGPGRRKTELTDEQRAEKARIFNERLGRTT